MKTADQLGPRSASLTDLAAADRMRRAVIWRSPTETEWKAFVHGRLIQFGDFLPAVADVEGESWVLIQRVWHGEIPSETRQVHDARTGKTKSIWLDGKHPPEWLFAAFDNAGAVVAATDFDPLPPAWVLPAGVQSGASGRKV